jgi:pimeloyl-ACP methyl ester carboxylesterase
MPHQRVRMTSSASAFAPDSAPDGIDYADSGRGPTVLFVPGSCSTSAAWRPIQQALPQRWRFIATSLCGYGRTLETRTLDNFDIGHEVRVVAAAAHAAGGGPIHLVGHSFGGTVALAAARVGAIEVASLSLFEANPRSLLRHHGHAKLHDETLRMSQDFEHAVQAGERDAAARIIDFWGDDGNFAAFPAPVQDYCRLKVGANVLDWRSAFAFDFSGDDLAQMDFPVLLVRGERANPAMVAMTELLGSRLPRVHGEVVDGAGHFLINSHPVDCADVLGQHLIEFD